MMLQRRGVLRGIQCDSEGVSFCLRCSGMIRWMRWHFNRDPEEVRDGAIWRPGGRVFQAEVAKTCSSTTILFLCWSNFWPFIFLSLSSFVPATKRQGTFLLILGASSCMQFAFTLWPLYLLPLWGAPPLRSSSPCPWDLIFSLGWYPLPTSGIRHPVHHLVWFVEVLGKSRR